MKILTNVRFYHLAGISQTVQSFLSSFKRQDGDKIVGVNLADTSEINYPRIKNASNNCRIISKQIQFPNMNQTIQNCRTTGDLEKNYKEIINAYRAVMKNEKPDTILINGTYFLPWCLYQASLSFKTKRILHYHGILTKEIAHWKKNNRFIFEQMEKTFDNKNLLYIFPSYLAKKTVEDKVFNHKIKSNFAVLPNPIFFKPTLRDAKRRIKRKDKRNVGSVTRWTAIKNPLFLRKIAKHDLKRGDKFDFHVVTDLSDKSRLRKKLNCLLNFQSSMNHAALKKYYGSMDLIISPSHFETYGNVAQEALVHGTPALVSSGMGVAETFNKFGLDRYVIDFNSTSNVYKQIEEISHERVDYNLRRLMAAELSPNKIHGKILSVIKSF